MTDTKTFAGCSLREKLKAIRDDADRPNEVRFWARNIVQEMDDADGMTEDELKAVFMRSAAILHMAIDGKLPLKITTPDAIELAVALGLRDPQ